jgi:uncharacterized protein
MTDLQFLNLENTVVWATFAIAFALAVVMSHSNFCTMGAVSDIVNMGDWTRMRMWLFAIAVAIAGTALLVANQQIDLAKSIYTGPKLLWLSNLIGGLLFGFGMVLASGCGSKTLLRLGAGSLKSLVVFLVMGLFAYMSLRGVFGVLRTNFLDSHFVQLVNTQDIALLLGAQWGNSARLWIALLIAAIIVIFCLKDKEFRAPINLFSALLIGVAIIAGWAVSGVLGHVAENPKTLEEAFVRTNSGKMESFSFVAPVAYTIELLMFWSDQSRVVSSGIAATLGMIAGAFAYALIFKSFRWEGFAGVQDTANHLIGAALMGVGGVTALGCTVGQGLSGLSTLAAGSVISFLAILLGAFAGLKYQIWQVEKSL